MGRRRRQAPILRQAGEAKAPICKHIWQEMEDLLLLGLLQIRTGEEHSVSFLQFCMYSCHTTHTHHYRSSLIISSSSLHVCIHPPSISFCMGLFLGKW